MAMSKKLAERVRVLTRWGKDPLDILMDFAVNDKEPAVRLDAAKAAAPYVHAKLKQVEVTDQRPDERTPESIENEIATYLAEKHTPSDERAARDLIGFDRGSEGGEGGELH